jgi:hypothetical protein
MSLQRKDLRFRDFQHYRLQAAAHTTLALALEAVVATRMKAD